jgi:hypothetical protein
MIRIRLINEGRVVKQITSRLHEGVVLEQIKKYKDPYDTVQIVEGELSEGAKDMLHHVAKKIVPAALAAGMAMSGASNAQAQGGANPHYPGLNHSVGQQLSDIFSPNYKELRRQRDHQRSTERQVWDAEQNEIRKQRVNAARAAAGGGNQPVIYDQSRLSQDGKSYIIYGIDNKVRRIPVAGTEYMHGDSQRLPHYITSGGNVLYVRHPHAVTESVAEGTDPNKQSHAEAFKSETDTMKPDTKKYVGRKGGKEVHAKKDAQGNVKFYHRDGIKGPLKAVNEGVAEGYTVTRGIDRERYQERPGLEGPFSTRSGKVVYYDPQEGKYYDPETDFYIGHEDYAKMDEDAPALVKGAAGLALGGLAAAGAPAIVAILGPLLGIPMAAYGAYSAAKLGMKGVEKLWDMASDKLGGDDKVAQYTNAKLATLPPEQAQAGAAVVKKIGESKQGVVESDPNATVGTIPSTGTSGGTGRTQFAPTGKTTNAKFNKNGQIELDTEQEDDGSVNLDPDAVKQLQQAGVKIKETDDDGRDKFYYQRNNIWRVMDGDDLVDEYKAQRNEIVGAKKLLARYDDEGYDVDRVISPMGFVTYLYGKPVDEATISESDSPVASAIARRIMSQRLDLLQKYGPVKVTAAIDEVADFVGDVEEIGSSDVSGWVKHVEQMLRDNPPAAFGEASDTLEGILSKYSADYAKFKAGGDIDENQDFFDALYAYYSESGEMPYGVQKARDGDPYEWITQRLDHESGVSPVIEADGDEASADQNIIMQIRKASDYEKPTKIELADGTESVIAPNIAKQLLAKFDKMKPESKELLQNTLNTEEGFKEIIAYFGGGVREQAAARVGNIMQSAMAEAGYGRYDRRDAYQRDYDSSVAGMGKRQSYAYQMDGGANDEGWDKPEQERAYYKKSPVPAKKGYYFYNVPADQTAKAEELGLFKTKSGKWYSPFENTRANMFFGAGRYWEPK